MSTFNHPIVYSLNFLQFTGLSDEEVRAMEGTERRAVEARVNCLRNIGVLLDAAAIQLQQYTSILATIRFVFLTIEGVRYILDCCMF